MLLALGLLILLRKEFKSKILIYQNFRLGSSIMSGASNGTTFVSSNTKTVRMMVGGGHTTTQIINPVLSTNLNYVPIRSTFA